MAATPINNNEISVNVAGSVARHTNSRVDIGSRIIADIFREQLIVPESAREQEDLSGGLSRLLCPWRSTGLFVRLRFESAQTTAECVD